MKKNKKLLVLVALFLAVFAVGGTLAYLTDTTDPVTNTFTFGKVKIELSETWKPEDGKGEDGLGLNPGAVVDKSPKITVKDDSKPAYVFMEVEMPDQVNDKDVLALGATDGSWYLLSDNGKTKIYAYGSKTAMTKLNKNKSTTELFQKVTVNGDLKNADLEKLAGGANIVIKGYAIQADDLGDITAPDAVWEVLQNQ